MLWFKPATKADAKDICAALIAVHIPFKVTGLGSIGVEREYEQARIVVDSALAPSRYEMQYD